MIKQLVETLLGREIDKSKFKLAAEMATLDIKFNTIGFKRKISIVETVERIASCVTTLERGC